MYYKRLIEKQIAETLETIGAVVVAGPKFCGKTTTCKLFSNSEYSLITKEKILFAQSNPKIILEGKTPRLIDEWQNVPDLWNYARSEIDSRENKFGQFIFTGSSTPVDLEDIYHSGAGRIVTLQMRPMSLAETGESKSKVSIKDIFDNKPKFTYSNEDHDMNDIAFYICRGGWPLSIVEDRKRALKITENYINSLFEFENNKNKKFRNKKKETFLTILKSYARHVSTEAKRTTILEDVKQHEDRKMDTDTFDEYVRALNDLYIIKDIDAWNPNFRSKTSIITSATRHFVDTSIAAGVLNISPQDLINNPATLGLFFEDFAVKELSIYAQALGGEIRHYRDSNGLECDAIIHLKDGRYGLIEIKLGGEQLINEGIRNLNNLSEKINKSGNNPPSFKMILTAVGNAYSVNEDTYIVPINMLRD